MDPKHKIGDRVFWHDPDDGLCSGPGTVTGVDGDVLSVAKDDGGAIECHASEATIQRCAHALALLGPEPRLIGSPADARAYETAHGFGDGAAPGPRTCAACSAVIAPRVRVSFEIVTPESAEDGDVAETGWINEEGIAFDASDLDPEDPTCATYGDVIARFITRDRGAVECSDSSPEVPEGRGRAPWFMQSDPDVDYRTGEQERHSYHVEGLTSREWRALFVALGLRRPWPPALSDNLIRNVATRFVEVLEEWLSPEEMAEVRERNADEDDKLVCHSHDFCDANMAMLEAIEEVCNVTAADVCGQIDADTALWSAAWDLAKRQFLTKRD